MYLLVSQHVSGIIMPIIRRTIQSRQTAYGVQHCNINQCNIVSYVCILP
jgi:hypothetical protein